MASPANKKNVICICNRRQTNITVKNITSKAGVSKLFNLRAILYISHIYAGHSDKNEKKKISTNNLISSNIRV